MSLTSQHLFTNSPPSSRFTLYFTINNKNPNHLSLLPPNPITSRHHHLIHISNKTPLLNLTHNTKHSHSFKRQCSHNSTITPQHESFNLDSLLSISELLCLFSTTVIGIGFVVNKYVLGSQNALLSLIGKKVLLCGVVGLVCGVWIGAIIRRRQWWRICSETVRGDGSRSVNLVGRIEKLEEDVRSYATIVRVLSRQLEKLGIRFRVTRKALKEPISQAANLAQKNSEATRALAMQEDILEKELGEIQKVLLAMQEQQHKQLELILAIGKSGKLFENRQEPSNQAQAQSTLDMSNLPDGTKQMEAHGTEALGSRKGSNNDRT